MLGCCSILFGAHVHLMWIICLGAVLTLRWLCSGVHQLQRLASCFHIIRCTCFFPGFLLTTSMPCLQA